MLFRYVGNDPRLALCNMGLANHAEVHRSGAQSDRLRAVVGCCSTEASLVTAVKTRDTKPPSEDRQGRETCTCNGSQAIRVQCGVGVKGRSTACCGVTSPFSHARSEDQQGDLDDEFGGMKVDTIKLLNDDDGRLERCTLWNSRKTCVILECVLLLFPLPTGNLIAARSVLASCRCCARVRPRAIGHGLCDPQGQGVPHSSRTLVSVRPQARYTDALNAIFSFVPTCVQVSWC